MLAPKHACMYLLLIARLHVLMHVCMYEYMLFCMYACICACMCARNYMYAGARVFVYVCHAMQRNTYIHICIICGRRGA